MYISIMSKLMTNNILINLINNKLINFVNDQYINNLSTINTNSYNKCKIIDYFILLKLIFRKNNIHMYDDFFKDLVLYLTPTIDNTFFYETITYEYYIPKSKKYCTYPLKDFINMLNIKNIILHLINDNNHIDIYLIDIIIYHKKNDPTNLLYIFLKIYEKGNKYYSFNHCFDFELPQYVLNNKYINAFKNYSFEEFDNYIIDIYNNNYGNIMCDYIDSNKLKKDIYFDLFKKLVIKILENEII